MVVVEQEQNSTESDNAPADFSASDRTIMVSTGISESAAYDV